jgi:hypothetical protein
MSVTSRRVNDGRSLHGFLLPVAQSPAGRAAKSAQNDTERKRDFFRLTRGLISGKVGLRQQSSPGFDRPATDGLAVYGVRVAGASWVLRPPAPAEGAEPGKGRVDMGSFMKQPGVWGLRGCSSSESML